MSEYPEHEKLQKVRDESQAQGEFLEWLSDEKDLFLCRWVDDHDYPVPVHPRIDDLLAEFHGIDQNKLEDEKRHMLDTIRAAQEGSEG